MSDAALDAARAFPTPRPERHPMTEKPLTAREAAFVEAYRQHGNASRAAREAGYAAHQANAIGWKVLRRPKIVAALRAVGIEIVLTPKADSALRKYPRTYRRNGLTVLQERFVFEYLSDGNATQAAIRAGFAGNPLDTGTRMLHQPEVARAIERERATTAARLGISAQRVGAELARIAFADIGDIADWGPDGVVLKEKAAVSKHDRAAIAELSTTKAPRKDGAKDGAPDGVSRTHLRMHSKQAALDGLARFLGLYGRGARTIARMAAQDESEKQDANTILRERLLRIARSAPPEAEAKKDEDKDAAGETES